MPKKKPADAETLTVFWRIENFSLIGPGEVVESPNFRVISNHFLCFLAVDTAADPGQVVRLTLHNRDDYRDSSESATCWFVFYAQIGGGSYVRFHSGGRIDAGVRNGGGLLGTRSCLLHRLSQSPHDSLTFKVVFGPGSRHNPTFHRKFSVTRIPETRLTFVWEIVGLSTGVSDTDIPSPPLRFRITKLTDPGQNAFEVTVTYCRDEWIDIPCVVYLMKESTVIVANFTMHPGALDSGSYPKGSFTISNAVYESHVRRSLGNGGKLTLFFEFRIRDVRAVSEDFRWDEIYSGKRESPKLFVKSTSSGPATSEELRMPKVQAEDKFQGDRTGDKNGERVDRGPLQQSNESVNGTMKRRDESSADQHLPVHQDFTLNAISSVKRESPKLFVKSTSSGPATRSGPATSEEPRMPKVQAEEEFQSGRIGGENGEMEPVQQRNGSVNGTMKRCDESSANPHLAVHQGCIYSDPVFSDFTLSAGGRSFPVHRSILSARSGVFRVMFEADMREKRENCSEVPVADVDRMLRYVYFADPDEESAAKLFAAVDRSQIGSLRSKCVQSLGSRPADDHSDASLKTRAEEFASLNVDRVVRSGQWKRLMAENINLARCIMQQIFLTL